MEVMWLLMPEGQFWAQTPVEEALRERKKELEGTGSKVGERKNSKTRSRELQEAPPKSASHGSPALMIDDEFQQ